MTDDSTATPAVLGGGAADVEDRVRRYARAVLRDGAANTVDFVTRFETGDRHIVYRVSSTDGSGGTTDVVVRVSSSDEPAERIQAELEAAVLEKLDGLGAPRLYDFRPDSVWFPTPVMCLEFVDGERRDLRSASLDDVARLGAVVASVHNLPVDDLLDRFPGATTIPEYVDERVDLNASYLPRFCQPLPAALRARVDRAFASVATSAEGAQRVGRFRTDDRLVLLHGDVASGNILWSPEPVLIDWEYARLGDPADEVAYVFGQHGLTPAQREAFWTGYGRATAHPRLDDVRQRARWWEPVLLLGSALWWLERWSRRSAADAAGDIEASVPKPQRYYLDHAVRRLDLFDEAIVKPPCADR